MKFTSSLTATLEESLRRQGVCGRRLVVAVSGGADSVALLRGVIDCREALMVTPIVAHFHHGLRGAEADADAEFVAALATTYGVPCRIGRAEPSDRYAPGIEERARDQRYEFLKTVAAEQDAEAILTAHTASDQAETVLHHVLRGTGITGLKGIPEVRSLSASVRILRPLLAVTRTQILEDLQVRGQLFCTDTSNADVRHRRNWLRHQLLPQIREVFPHTDDALCRLGQQAAEVSAALATWADELLDAAWQPWPSLAGSNSCLAGSEADRFGDDQPPVQLLVAALASRPRHVLREVFVRLWTRQNWPRQEMTAAHWDRAVDVLLGIHPATMFPAGIEVIRRGERVTAKPPRPHPAR